MQAGLDLPAHLALRLGAGELLQQAGGDGAQVDRLALQLAARELRQREQAVDQLAHLLARGHDALQVGAAGGVQRLVVFLQGLGEAVDDAQR
ncbi:hypothetical protein FQZ97_833560 [compost metagenome]